MKRIAKSRKTKKIREAALKQLRETRSKLEKDNPGLLENMRKIVEKAGHVEKTFEKPANTPKKPPPARADEDDMVSIDRKKNLEAILKYAALKPGSDKLKRELKDFLN